MIWLIYSHYGCSSVQCLARIHDYQSYFFLHSEKFNFLSFEFKQNSNVNAIHCRRIYRYNMKNYVCETVNWWYPNFLDKHQFWLNMIVQECARHAALMRIFVRRHKIFIIIQGKSVNRCGIISVNITVCVCEWNMDGRRLS